MQAAAQKRKQSAKLRITLVRYMNKNQQQIIALAGLFQAMATVDELAQEGQCEEAHLETALNSLFITDPKDTLSVYGDLSKLRTGLEMCYILLGKTSTYKRLNSVRYALAIIHLENKLTKDKDMLNMLGQRLSRAENQIQHFGLTHDNVLASIASIYTDTISTFKLRVQISGQERFLTIDRNAAKIRALLLAGIRAATLWRQLGGHRWHFVLKRKTLAKESAFLLSKASPNPD